MKKTAFTILALALIVSAASAVATITEGPGISFYVTGLTDGTLIQVDADGYLYSNGDGTYSSYCPFSMPIELKNGKLKLYLYSGNNELNIVKVEKDGNTLTWIQHDYYFDIRYNFPQGQYNISVNGETELNKFRVKFQLTGKKYGPRDFYIDANGIQGKGDASIRILIGGVKKFEKKYTFDTTGVGDKTILIPKVVTPSLPTPRPTPTPQPTKSPGQIWAERNCWWYRVT